MKRQAIYRLVDANFNRAKEGLRVAEDIMRFVYNDVSASRQLKTLRHGITRCLLAFPVTYAKLLEARSSIRDVGRGNTVKDQIRSGWTPIVIRNLKRAQEALRVLEEAARVIAPRTVTQLEGIRFKAYELEKRIVKKLSSLRSH